MASRKKPGLVGRRVSCLTRPLSKPCLRLSMHTAPQSYGPLSFWYLSFQCCRDRPVTSRFFIVAVPMQELKVTELIISA